MKDPPTPFGSLAAGLLASACCIGPLIPGAIGAAVEKTDNRAKATASGSSVSSSNPTSKLAGQWRGNLTVNEEGEATELSVDLDRVAESWTGQFDLPDFGVVDYPVEVAFSGHTVTLQLSAAPIEFIGALNQAADTLAGMAETLGHRDFLVLRPRRCPSTFRGVPAPGGVVGRLDTR